MSSDFMWKRDADGVEHLRHEILLAFIREQCSEYEKSRIREHLLAGCAPCNTLRAGLAQDSATLNHLQHMSPYLYYPELQSNQILLHAQRGEPLTSVWTGKRKRKFQARSGQQIIRRYAHKRSVRIVSLPVAFAMLLVFMTAALVLAYTIVSLFKLPLTLPWQQPNNFYVNPVSHTPGVAPHQITPTNTVAVTITTTPSGNGDGSTTIINGAGLKACSPNHYAGSAIYICGEGFKAGDKVWLEVNYYGSNSLRKLGPYTVNKDGKFKAYWSISCKNSPIIVYAADKMQQPLTEPLTNISRFGCSGPTPTTSPGGHQYNTN